MDGVMCNIMTQRVTPSMLIKVVKVAVCAAKYGKVVSLVPEWLGKWTYLHHPIIWFLLYTRTDVWEYVLHIS
jgi:hypothetical protein